MSKEYREHNDKHYSNLITRKERRKTETWDSLVGSMQIQIIELH